MTEIPEGCVNVRNAGSMIDRTLKNDDEVKRVWTIDGIFHCIVVENNAEVKKRLETPDDLFKLGWSQENMLDSGLFTLH